MLGWYRRSDVRDNYYDTRAEVAAEEYCDESDRQLEARAYMLRLRDGNEY